MKFSCSYSAKGETWAGVTGSDTGCLRASLPLALLLDTGGRTKGTAEGFRPLAERSESDSELALAADAGATDDARCDAETLRRCDARSACRGVELDASSDAGSATVTLAGDRVPGGEFLGELTGSPGGGLRDAYTGVASGAPPV